jgi:hypothetical protein
MWQNWVSGIIGLFIVLTPFLNFSLSLERTVLMVSGVVVAILSFWASAEKNKSCPKCFAGAVPPTTPVPPAN